MVQKICPYCDQVYSGGPYCPHCKSRVRLKDVRTIDFYFNQKHPSDEINCSFHTTDVMASAPQQAKRQNNAKQPGKPAQSGSFSGNVTTTEPLFNAAFDTIKDAASSAKSAPAKKTSESSSRYAGSRQVPASGSAFDNSGAPASQTKRSKSKKGSIWSILIPLAIILMGSKGCERVVEDIMNSLFS